MSIISSLSRVLLPGLLLLAGFMGGCSTPGRPYPGGVHEAQLHKEVVEIARELVGTPYHYGGRSPKTGFDCSGLVYYTHMQAGLELPRTSLGQLRATQPVSFSGLQPGDLVFFRFSRYKVSHVGIYIGHHRFVHAPSNGKEVTVDSLNDPYWRKRFVRGGRIL
ncbi:MAG: NlpC/P60 family protein [Gammaproteobacteria bacterium]|nr:NlpC/P60 family protein [Gammaproteobacteria bacterium]